ncbi:MAG TPA: glycosyltransferase [Desulfobacteraceae bacterium]|nr:glycosyltransferase [Desulfobacteraceae bacterium]
MLCYYYPPLVDVGCKRSVAFSKYFKKHGWTPHVLSVKNPDRTYCSLGDDPPPREVHTEYSYSIINVYKFFGKLNGLLSRILKLFGMRLKRNYFIDIFCIPDIFWGWIPLTILNGLKLIRQYNIDVIYASCPPFSAAVTGILLKKITNKPLVLDFRDPYALDIPISADRPRFRRLLDRKIESFFLKQADIFVVVTKEIQTDYARRYYGLKDRMVNIYNGFDHELKPRGSSGKYSKFTIIYTGNFYSGIEAMNSFTHSFFEGVRRLKEDGVCNTSNFQFLYYGDEKAAIENIATDYGIHDLLVANSRISHQEMLSVLSRSHLQLIRIVKPALGSKLLEGLALNVPLLATIPCGEVEEIIRKYSPGSYVVSHASPEQVAGAIRDAMNKYKDNKIQDNRVDEFMKEFSRENLTRVFMDIIEEKTQVAK